MAKDGIGLSCANEICNLQVLQVQKAQKVPQYQTVFQISCKIYLVFASLGKGMAASGLKEAAD
jgi:hypothetical protein